MSEDSCSPLSRDALRSATRRSWLIVLFAVAYVFGFLCLAIKTNLPGKPPQWDMDGTPFVPAISLAADGYPLPLHKPEASPDDDAAKEAPR